MDLCGYNNIVRNCTQLGSDCTCTNMVLSQPVPNVSIFNILQYYCTQDNVLCLTWCGITLFIISMPLCELSKFNASLHYTMGLAMCSDRYVLSHTCTLT